MRTRLGSEVINQNRRQLLTTAAMGIAAAGAASLFPASSHVGGYDGRDPPVPHRCPRGGPR